MSFETAWREIRDRCEGRADAVFLTPRSDRSFTVQGVSDDRIEITYRESGSDRTLWRDQFEVLFDRLAEGRQIDLATLPPGVEPYVAVLSLDPRYAVADGALGVVETPSEESPFVRRLDRPDVAAVRDDAVVLASLLADTVLEELGPLSNPDVVDLYVMLSEVQRGSDDLRLTVSDELLDRIGPDGRLRGRFGTVTRVMRDRRHLKDDATVFDALDELGIPREWVTGIDPEKLDVVLSVTDLETEDVYDVETQTYVQKTGVEGGEKDTYLAELRDRLSGVESEEAAELRDELDDLEARIEDLLAPE